MPRTCGTKTLADLPTDIDMIYVYFCAGAFGSTVEYVLRSFTNEYTPVKCEIATDGSMHGFRKFNHLGNTKTFTKFYNSIDYNNSKTIVTPVYPSSDGVDLTQIILESSPYYQSTDKFVLLHVNSVDYAEINRLFQYHKIFNGSVYKKEYTVSDDVIANIKRWNSAYQHVNDMQPWEFREWQSFFDYEPLFRAPTQVPNYFLKVSTHELLNNTADTFEKIISWCGLTRSSADLMSFVTDWRKKQQYVLDEHNLIVELVNATINKVSMPIPDNLNMFAQAIIQQRLRRAGYEIQCDGLNKLPKNTILLYKSLDKNNI